MERFAEQDRLEQMNAQKRRLKVAQHAREVERLIQEKREMYEAAMVSIHLFAVNLLSYAELTDCCTAGLFCYWVQLACSAIGHALPQGCKWRASHLCLCSSLQSHSVQEACQAWHRPHYTHSNRLSTSSTTAEL